MADFLVVKTLETDDEIPNDDSQSESDTQSKTNITGDKRKKKVKKRKKASQDFNQDFNFSFGGPLQNTSSWKIDQSVKDKAKGRASIEITEEKINEKFKEKKKQKALAKKNDFKTTLSAADVVPEIHENEDDTDSNSKSDDDMGSGDEESDAKDEDTFFQAAPKQVAHKSFAHMNLSRPLLKAVNELNYENPTKVQAAAIPVALLGKDLCACATTGSGKTAAFMLPILERLLFKPKQTPASRVLVLVPTRELAIQVHSVSEALAKHSSVDICLAAGGLDLRAQEAALRKSPDVIIATPGRLIDHLRNTPSFDLQMIEVLILDEADRMLEEHFKDQLDEIIRLCPKGRQTMLFSATMTDEVQELVSLSLNHPVKLFVDQNTDVASKLHQEFVRIRQSKEDDRLAIVTALCCRSFRDHTLVFVQTKHLAHKLRIVLGLQGLKATELHGNLTQLQRLEALEKYKDAEVDILVATDLAARGLDIAGVKTVISFNMPTTIKSYIHRVGRTARAGRAGRSITLVGEKERKMLKDVVKNAHVPVKNRIIPQDVIEKYKKKLEELEADIKDILKQEQEEKELRITEMEMRKAENMVIHRDEIMSRPARTFIKTTTEKKQKKPTEKKPKQSMTDEDKKLLHEQDFQKRLFRKEKRPKRIRAYQEDDPNRKAAKIPKKHSSSTSSRTFDKELTDTSKKSVKSLRHTPHIPKKKKGVGSFKSKSKHKRR